MAAPQVSECPTCGSLYPNANGHCEKKGCAWLVCPCGTVYSTLESAYANGGGFIPDKKDS
jgi:hypothetical protein